MSLDAYCEIISFVFRPYNVYENVTGEYGDFKWIVCRDYCSKQTMVAGFMKKDEAIACAKIYNWA